MERPRNFNSNSSRNKAWALIGYFSFGILGILLGAALVYGVFYFFLVPHGEEIIPGEVAVEEENDVPGEVSPSTPGRDLERDLVTVVDQVMPAVVGVSSQYDFAEFGGQQFEQTESASGVVISPDGYIITNHHVIQNAEQIKVIMPEKGVFEAELVGSDPMTDLALIRIDESNLTYAPLADSGQARVGETVLAIGNPLGLQQTVTAGIISAVDRQVMIPGTDYAYTFIQTDAVVNPGNSGGPLVNLEGEVVGINTAKIALPGVEGIGFSVPSNTVDRVTRDFLEYRKVLRPHMGVLIEDWLNYEDPKPDMGIRLIEIVPESPADEAGLVTGDIIVAIDDQNINFLAQLFDIMLYYYPGDTVAITFYRDGEVKQTKLTFDERPDNLFEEPFDPEDFEDEDMEDESLNEEDSGEDEEEDELDD